MTLRVNGDDVGGGAGASLSDATPAALGTAAAGVATSASRADHVHQAPAPSAAGSIGHSWERPSPTTAGPGATFVDTDSLTELVSTGLVVAPGVAASGWMQRLPSGVGAGRAGLAGAVGRRAYAESLDLDAYVIGGVTVAVLFTWDGTQPSTYSLSEVVTFGDRNNDDRGIHILFVTNGANTDLKVFSNSGGATLVASANLLPGAVGLHCLVVAPVDVAGIHKWRFSYDGSVVADVTMGAAYVAPSSSDSISLGARTDGLIYLNGSPIELAVWGSLLSSADILALATLPGTPTYEIPESASTGAAAIRVQASRYDPITSVTTMRARGLSTALTVSTGTTKVTL